MLNSIAIENYALIDKLTIRFDRGLSIITGETGAGKSILLGAISLILGQRADAASLKNKEKSCIVEGVFSIDSYQLEGLFADNDVEYQPISTFRRIVSPNGKSRAFINDVPVTLTVLKSIADRLIDIHSQHQNLLVSDSSFQLWVVDSLAGNADLLKAYKQSFLRFKEIEKRLSDLKLLHEQSKADYDYYLFQYQQLEEAKLRDGEQQELEDELTLLTHAEEIKVGYSKAATILSNDELGANSMLYEATQLLSKLSSLAADAEPLAQRLESCLIELRDVANELEQKCEAINFSPHRQSEVEERLDLIYSLQQKHRTDNVATLLDIQATLGEKVEAITNFDEQLAAFEKEKQVKESELGVLADQLTEKRAAILPSLQQRVGEMLRALGMPNATFITLQVDLGTFLPAGKTSISFLFSANKDGVPQEIYKVASGGEISRLMLTLKSLVAQKSKLPTIVFDEIDTGISGEVADKMGQLICWLAERNQVINITHLPQVASKGDAHYLVYKQDIGHSTVTSVKLLNDEERLMEIAKMLSGSNVTEAAISNARELMKK